MKIRSRRKRASFPVGSWRRRPSASRQRGRIKIGGVRKSKKVSTPDSVVNTGLCEASPGRSSRLSLSLLQKLLRKRYERAELLNWSIGVCVCQSIAGERIGNGDRQMVVEGLSVREVVRRHSTSGGHTPKRRNSKTTVNSEKHC